MLVLTMDRNNSVTLAAGEQVIIVQLLSTKGGSEARVGFAASKHVKIVRTGPIISGDNPDKANRPPPPKPSFPPPSGTMTKGG